MKALTIALLASLGAACHRPAGEPVPPGPHAEGGPSPRAGAIPDTVPPRAPMPGRGRMMHHGVPVGHGMGMAGMEAGMRMRMGMRPPAAVDSASAPAPAAAVCPAVSPVLASQGARIFAGAGNCTACHGPRGSGTPVAPRLSDREWLNVDGSYPALAELIRTGVPRPKQHPGYMPAKGGAPLGDAEVCAVAAYVYSLTH
ncbi:MAG TPA: c-type cytochrome [Longimicrobium sp.]|nr:c-type cytochrome [Longimicrobium sp.]